MAAERKPLHIRSEQDFNQLVRDAASSGPVLVEIDNTLYEIEAYPVAEEIDDGIAPERDSLFNIIGMGSSDEPTDIERYKDEYLAEAYDRR